MPDIAFDESMIKEPWMGPKVQCQKCGQWWAMISCINTTPYPTVLFCRNCGGFLLELKGAQT